MNGIFKRLRRDETGATMVEFAVVLFPTLLVLGGAIDFFIAYWQWNTAVKAVERGARIAAVSCPVAQGLNTAILPVTTAAGQPSGVDSIAAVTCDGASQSCTGGYGYSATAMNAIVYGRGNNSCVANPGSVYAIGMCNLISWRIPPTDAYLSPANVKIEYRQTGLGFQGGNPVPTITVWLQNVNFRFFFLSGLLNFGQITIPLSNATNPVKTSITGEDLSSFAPGNPC